MFRQPCQEYTDSCGCAPGSVRQVPAMPAGGSGLCSQLLRLGARWLRRWKALSAGLPAAHAVPMDVPATCWAEPTQHLPFWAVLSRMHVGSSVLPRGPVPAQAGLHVPAAGGARSMPHASHQLAGLSSLVHPLEVALRCNSHRARRRGLVRGHRGEELRMVAGRPRGTGPAPGCASLLPRGFPGAPPTPPHGLAVAEIRMLSLPEVPDPPPDIPPYPFRRRRGTAAGMEPQAEQRPPSILLAIRGSAPSPTRVGGGGGSRSSCTPVRRGCPQPGEPPRAPWSCRHGETGRGRHTEGSRMGMNGHGGFCGWAQLWEGKQCGRAQGHVQRDSPCPGGLPAAQPSRRHPLPSSALPQSVQYPKEAKETCGGRDAGRERRRPPLRALSCRSKLSGVPLCSAALSSPGAIPRACRCPGLSSAHGVGGL